MAITRYRLVDGSDELLLSGIGGASPIIVIDSEFTAPAAREVSHPRLGLSGKRDFTRLHDSSEFTATLKIQGDETGSRYEHLDELKRFLAFHKRPYLYILRDGWLSERRCLLRGAGTAVVVGKTSGIWLDATIRASLPEGAIEDNEATLLTLRPGSVTVGTSYPMSYPMYYEPGTASNTAVVMLSGNDFSQPYIRIFGQCDDPEFTLTTPDGEVQYFSTSGLSVPLGSYLDIDFTNRKVFMDGSQTNSYYSKVDFTASSWWALEPGSNLLSFNASNPSAGCYAEITYRNTYLP